VRGGAECPDRFHPTGAFRNVPNAPVHTMGLPSERFYYLLGSCAGDSVPFHRPLYYLFP